MYPGDVILCPSPTYPNHQYAAVLAGGGLRCSPLITSEDFFGHLEEAIKQTWPKPKMLIISFPHNPTTEVVELDFFERIVRAAKEHELMVIHDLAYADLTFDGFRAPSFLQVPGAKDVGVEFFSLSKSYNMPGWRVGFAVGNPDIIHALARIKSYLDYGIFQPIQIAAIQALNGRRIALKRSGYYRKKLNYSDKAMETAARRLRDFRDGVAGIRREAGRCQAVKSQISNSIRDSFVSAMDNDMSVKAGFDAVQNVLNKVDPLSLTADQAAGIIRTLKKIDEVVQVIF